MNNILKIFIAEYNKKLEGALLSCALTSINDSEMIFNYNANNDIVISLGKLITEFSHTIIKLGLPPIENFQMIKLELDTLLLAIYLDNNHILTSIVDSSKVTYGLLLDMVPDLITEFENIKSKLN